MSETTSIRIDGAPWMPTPEDVEQTAAAEAQMDNDPLARIRPITRAIWAAVRAKEPRIPNALLGQFVTDYQVWELLCELEKQGYTIVPCELRL